MALNVPCSEAAPTIQAEWLKGFCGAGIYAVCAFSASFAQKWLIWLYFYIEE
jgi:hypothetical protein